MPDFNPYHKWLGIAPDERLNHYRVLGLQPFESDHDVIANAADQRMSHIRTFQGGRHSDLSQKLLNEIAAARVCLLNPAKKAEYDEQLRQQLASTVSSPPPAIPTPAMASIGPPPLSRPVRRRQRAPHVPIVLGGSVVICATIIIILIATKPKPETGATGNDEPSPTTQTQKQPVEPGKNVTPPTAVKTTQPPVAPPSAHVAEKTPPKAVPQPDKTTPLVAKPTPNATASGDSAAQTRGTAGGPRRLSSRSLPVPHSNNLRIASKPVLHQPPNPRSLRPAPRTRCTSRIVRLSREIRLSPNGLLRWHCPQHESLMIPGWSMP